MNCPRCHVALDERDREGISIDVCGGCRGVWLDRGELEKLISRASRELDDIAPGRDSSPPRGTRAQTSDPGTHHPRKKRWTDILGDIFD